MDNAVIIHTKDQDDRLYLMTGLRPTRLKSNIFCLLDLQLSKW